MTRVFYVGSFRFPEGDAAAARVLGLGKSLRAAGLEVVFAGWEQQERSGDRMENGSHFYQGFGYHSQNEFRQSDLTPAKRLMRYLQVGKKTIGWMKLQKLTADDVVIAYGGTSLFLLGLSSFCKQRRIRMIVDCVEWYDPRHLVGGQFGPVRWDEECRMRMVNKKIGNVIAISSYLEAYYRKAGCHVIRIPPLVDIQEPKWNDPGSTNARGESLRLAYAGTPGKKDLLENVVRGLNRLRAEGIRVELHLAGPSVREVRTCLGGDGKILRNLEDVVVYRGRVQQSQVPSILQECDFSVLLRPYKRYARAGFPTKLVESLAAGVPVVTNPTSDIAQYVRDGQEGILLKDPSEKAFSEGVKRILGMSRNKWQEMRRCSRRRAADCFDFRNYIAPCQEFIQSCRLPGSSAKSGSAECRRS